MVKGEALFERPPLDDISDQFVGTVLGLGYPMNNVQIAPGMDPSYVVERDRLTDLVRGTVAQRYETYAERAAALNISIPALAEWVPPEQEVQAMREISRNERVRMQMLDGLNEFIETPKYMRKLRPQQRDALRKTRLFMELMRPMRDPNFEGDVPGDGKSGYIDMPTGTGKTGAFISIVRALKLKEDPKDPIKVLVLVPTVQLLQQTVGDKTTKPSKRQGFAKFWPAAKPTKYFGDVKDISDVTVMTNASFNQLVQSGEMPEFDVIIPDETHTDLGENISDSMRQYYGNKVTIGLTATPDYHEEKRTADLMMHEIYKLTLHDAVEKRMLAPVSAEHRPMRVKFEDGTLPDDPRERNKVVTAKLFEKNLEDMLERKDIQKAVREGKGVIIRCPAGGDAAYAYKAAERIRQEWVTTLDGHYRGFIRAVGIGGTKQNRVDQEILLNGFNDVDETDHTKRVHVICYVDLINMGTDLPHGKFYGDTGRRRAAIPVRQGVGRALRLVYDKHGQPIPAKVVTYDQSYEYEGEIIDFEQYSALDALEMKPGTPSLTWRGEYKEYTGSPFVYSEVPASADTTGAVGRAALRHGDVEYEEPEDDGLFSFDEACEYFDMDPEFTRELMLELGYEEGDDVLLHEEYYEIALLGSEENEIRKVQGRHITFEEACTEFKLKPSILKSYLERLGYKPDPVLREAEYLEIGILIEEDIAQHVAAAAQKAASRAIAVLPERGFVEVAEVMRQVEWRGSQAEFLRQTREYQVTIRRFRDPVDGKIKHYMAERNVRKK